METKETLQLLNRYWHLPRLIARQDYPLLSEAERDDLEAIGLMALLTAARAFRPGGVGFSTYAAVCIRRRFITERLANLRTRRRETGGASLVSLSDCVKEDGSPWEDVVPDAGADVDREVLLRDIWRRVDALPPRERLAVRLYYGQECTYREVGEAISQSGQMAWKTVDAAISVLRRQYHE